MACGTPAIGTNISGTTYVLENAGITVRPRDSDALQDAITNVLSSEHLQKEMSKRGLKKAKQFSWKNITKKVEQVYRRALR
jgi:glycosyltransferase involved in cell wall biosynthesis